jgi:altronate hydrolase
MCFTTGRGSAFGCKPTPSVKLATNIQVYASMIDDMDINCGDILDGVPVRRKGEEISARCWRRVRRAHQVEELGYGDAEFVPWQIGAVM